MREYPTDDRSFRFIISHYCEACNLQVRLRLGSPCDGAAVKRSCARKSNDANVFVMSLREIGVMFIITCFTCYGRATLSV